MIRSNQQYSQIEVGTDISMEDFKKEYSDVNMLPYVIIDGEQIGGLIEVARKFLKEGLVKPPQK
jgi:glutaredoxin-related protein